MPTAVRTRTSKTPKTRARTASWIARWINVKPDTSRMAFPAPTTARHASAHDEEDVEEAAHERLRCEQADDQTRMRRVGKRARAREEVGDRPPPSRRNVRSGFDPGDEQRRPEGDACAD